MRLAQSRSVSSGVTACTVAAGGGGRPCRTSLRAGGSACRRRVVCAGPGGALVAGPADDQRVRADRDDGLRDHERGAGGRDRSSDRPSDLEHAGLRSGRWSGACSCWGERGALHCGCGACAGLCGACGADGGAVCCGPVWCGGEPDVPHRGPGALARRRGAGVPGACGCAGEAARLPHRAWRDRGGAGAPCGMLRRRR